MEREVRVPLVIVYLMDATDAEVRARLLTTRLRAAEAVDHRLEQKIGLRHVACLE